VLHAAIRWVKLHCSGVVVISTLFLQSERRLFLRLLFQRRATMREAREKASKQGPSLPLLPNRV
jgi:hypothetical protein